MDSDFSLARKDAGSADSDFEFSFNDRIFSDRILKIENVPDFPDTKPDGGDGCNTLAEWAHNLKRHREEIRRDNIIDNPNGSFHSNEGSSGSEGQSAEQVLNLNVPDVEETLPYDNQDEEVVATIDESSAEGGFNLNEGSDWSSDTLLIPFTALQTSTCNFSDANKIGQ